VGVWESLVPKLIECGGHIVDGLLDGEIEGYIVLMIAYHSQHIKFVLCQDNWNIVLGEESLIYESNSDKPDVFPGHNRLIYISIYEG